MSPVQGKSPLVQVKEPYGNFDMVTCRLLSCNPECTSTPADNTRKRVWQYIEKERAFRHICDRRKEKDEKRFFLFCGSK